MSKTWFFLIHFLSTIHFVFLKLITLTAYRNRARRNAQGNLEPDASDDVVQSSLGFSGYEHAPKVEERTKTQWKGRAWFVTPSYGSLLRNVSCGFYSYQRRLFWHTLLSASTIIIQKAAKDISKRLFLKLALDHNASLMEKLSYSHYGSPSCRRCCKNWYILHCQNDSDSRELCECNSIFKLYKPVAHES